MPDPASTRQHGGTPSSHGNSSACLGKATTRVVLNALQDMLQFYYMGAALPVRLATRKPIQRKPQSLNQGNQKQTSGAASTSLMSSSCAQHHGGVSSLPASEALAHHPQGSTTRSASPADTPFVPCTTLEGPSSIEVDTCTASIHNKQHVPIPTTPAVQLSQRAPEAGIHDSGTNTLQATAPEDVTCTMLTASSRIAEQTQQLPQQRQASESNPEQPDHASRPPPSEAADLPHSTDGSSRTSKPPAIQQGTATSSSSPDVRCSDQDFWTASFCFWQHDHQYVPSSFVCPLSRTVMRDPVLAGDGITYDKAAIQAWFKLGQSSSPVTKQPLENRGVVPNERIRRAILQWRLMFTSSDL